MSDRPSSGVVTDGDSKVERAVDDEFVKAGRPARRLQGPAAARRQNSGHHGIAPRHHPASLHSAPR